MLLAIIPARAGSKGLPNKNIYPLNGHPLLAWTIAAAVDYGRFDRIIVSTDGEEIMNVARRYGAEVIVRPPHLATDQSPPKDAVRHVCATFAAAGARPDHIVYLQPTSPLREPGDIARTVELVRRAGFDSAASFTSAQPHPDRAFMLTDGGAAEPVHGHEAVWQPRQDRPPRLHLNGAIYVAHAEALLADTTNRMLPGRIGVHLMPRERSVDIDTLADLRICATFMAGRELPIGARN